MSLWPAVVIHSSINIDSVVPVQQDLWGSAKNTPLSELLRGPASARRVHVFSCLKNYCKFLSRKPYVPLGPQFAPVTFPLVLVAKESPIVCPSTEFHSGTEGSQNHTVLRAGQNARGRVVFFFKPWENCCLHLGVQFKRDTFKIYNSASRLPTYDNETITGQEILRQYFELVIVGRISLILYHLSWTQNGFRKCSAWPRENKWCFVSGSFSLNLERWFRA